MRFRFSTPRPWRPLSDAEWSLLAPYVPRDGMPESVTADLQTGYPPRVPAASCTNALPRGK